ncbi:hypothetical protein [Methylocella sp.]|uniref:hypothetical protein n=1 Tax=Methylocella sp. TaxID=1978226 RepID=UPI0035AE2B7E
MYIITANKVASSFYDLRDRLVGRLVVQADEAALLDDRYVINIADLANAVMRGQVQITPATFNADEFSNRTLRVKARTRPRKMERPEFLPLQFQMPALAIRMLDGEVVIDGRRRAEQVFQTSGAAINVYIVAWQDALAFTVDLQTRPRREQDLFAAMLKAPIRFNAIADSSVGADVVLNAILESVGNRPPLEGATKLLEALTVTAGAELVRREKIRLDGSRTQTRKALDALGFLSAMRTSLLDKVYEADYHLAEATATSKLPGLRRFIRRHFEDLGYPVIAENLLNLADETIDELRLRFVLCSRALRAAKDNASVRRRFERIVKGGLGKTGKDEKDDLSLQKSLQDMIAGTISEQESRWLNLSAQFELAHRTGIDPTEFYGNVREYRDLLRWHARVFYVRQGFWSPIESPSEAEQFLMWLTIDGSADGPERPAITKDQFLLIAWRGLFREFIQLPAPGRTIVAIGDNAASFAAKACFEFLEANAHSTV